MRALAAGLVRAGPGRRGARCDGGRDRRDGGAVVPGPARPAASGPRWPSTRPGTASRPRPTSAARGDRRARAGAAVGAAAPRCRDAVRSRRCRGDRTPPDAPRRPHGRRSRTAGPWSPWWSLVILVLAGAGRAHPRPRRRSRGSAGPAQPEGRGGAGRGPGAGRPRCRGDRRRGGSRPCCDQPVDAAHRGRGDQPGGARDRARCGGCARTPRSAGALALVGAARVLGAQLDLDIGLVPPGASGRRLRRGPRPPARRTHHGGEGLRPTGCFGNRRRAVLARTDRLWLLTSPASISNRHVLESRQRRAGPAAARTAPAPGLVRRRLRRPRLRRGPLALPAAAAVARPERDPARRSACSR